MSEREDEMTRRINERAQKIVNRPENSSSSGKSGKSYADFKKMQENKISSESPQNFEQASVGQNTTSSQQVQKIYENNSEQIEKKVMTFAAYGGF